MCLVSQTTNKKQNPNPKTITIPISQPSSMVHLLCRFLFFSFLPSKIYFHFYIKSFVRKRRKICFETKSIAFVNVVVVDDRGQAFISFPLLMFVQFVGPKQLLLSGSHDDLNTNEQDESESQVCI